MITANVLHRTFRIMWSDSIGTAFAIDHGSKQYLVTARHVVEGVEPGKPIQFFHDDKWKELAVDVVGVGRDEIDIAVLACPIRLAPSHPLVASSGNMVYGQPVFFLGYPFGWNSGNERLNRGIPLPFVKAGIVSALGEFGGVYKFYLDAHGNKGFSGGPMVFSPPGQLPTDLRVAGVVVNYPVPLLQPIVDDNRATITDSTGKPIGLYVEENPGIVVAIGIRHVIELIEANPIGFPLPVDGQQDYLSDR